MRSRVTLVIAIVWLVLPTSARAQSSTAVGVGTGVVAGAVLGGPIGAVVGGIAGGVIGSSSEPSRGLRVRRAQRARADRATKPRKVAARSKRRGEPVSPAKLAATPARVETDSRQAPQPPVSGQRAWEEPPSIEAVPASSRLP